MRCRLILPLAAVTLVVSACSAGTGATTTASTAAPTPTLPSVAATPAAPEVPEGPLSAQLVDDLEAVIATLTTTVDTEALVRIGQSGDPRVAWILSDLLRFIQFGPTADTALASFGEVTGLAIPDPAAGGGAWVDITNQLIGWDLPAPPGYQEYKQRLFTPIDERWGPFFSDPESEIDWRFVSWGGVFIDDRPIGDGSPCSVGCIPALDDPATTAASGGDWYPDDSLVFGIVVDGAARAYPKNMMEIHEMVNDVLAGRRVGVPYCTLCGSAQAYFTDSLSTGPVLLRTTGLLNRSNKIMFDLNTYSVFDTFLGRAVSGPLRGAVLDPITVVTSTWGEWKSAHPDTTILAQDGGIGYTYPADPLGGRDDFGPIFPVGPVDPRLPVQSLVLGVELPDGTPVAFPVDLARHAIEDGQDVESAGIRILADGGGLKAQLADGSHLPSHEAFWFAWSQFHPETTVWSPPG